MDSSDVVICGCSESNIQSILLIIVGSIVLSDLVVSLSCQIPWSASDSVIVEAIKEMIYQCVDFSPFSEVFNLASVIVIIEIEISGQAATIV